MCPYSLPLQLGLQLLNILHLPLHHSLPKLVIAAEGGLPSQSNTARRHRPSSNKGRQQHVNPTTCQPAYIMHVSAATQRAVLRPILHCSLQTSMEEVLATVW